MLTESRGPNLRDERPRAFLLATRLFHRRFETRSRLTQSFWHSLHGTPAPLGGGSSDDLHDAPRDESKQSLFR